MKGYSVECALVRLLDNAGGVHGLWSFAEGIVFEVIWGSKAKEAIKIISRQ
ncbi:MAG: hypothetical protein IIT71_06070 [Acetobacter sp.]|nr:hypothetical protein [Acetobacter sp.]MBQ5498108.1 hypothetical protein [Acetobacter sp.]MBQ5773507.1 hypothetical protein [Acetobacter sp.]